MNKRNTRRMLAALLLGLVWAALGLVPAHAAEPPSKQEAARLREMGTKLFGIKWTRTVHAAQERGVVAVTDGTTTLTQRGRRTFIVHNKEAAAAGDAKAFAGSDDELKKRGIRILEATGAKSSEVLEAKVLQQMTQAVYREPGGSAKLETAKKGRRTLLVTRQVDGIPVLSSRLVLDLDANGRIAFMELTWPDLAKGTLEMAQRLKQVSKREFKPPVMEAAAVESVQAVVLHSPAVGFFDDQVAALQVVYRPERPEVGKKPVRYLDVGGKDVPLPRQTDPLREEQIKRKSAVPDR